MRSATAPREDRFPEIWAALSGARLESLLSSLSPKPHGEYLLLSCPGCGERRAYFYPSSDGKGPRIRCNRRNNCGYDRTLWEYVKEECSGDSKAAYSLLAEAAGVQAAAGTERRPFSAPPRSKPKPRTAEPVMEGLDAVLSELQGALPGSLGEKYLSWRAIPPELAARYGAGYAADGAWPHRNEEERLIRQWKQGRTVIPHTDPDGRVISLYGRAVGIDPKVPKEQRHDHLPGNKGYFNAAALREGEGPLFVCEGPFDALSLIAAGHPRTVAIFGVNGWRWEWARDVQEIVFALDADKAGEKEWRELAREAIKRGKRVAVLPAEAYGGKKDVNEAWRAGVLNIGEWPSEPSPPRRDEPAESLQLSSALTPETVPSSVPIDEDGEAADLESLYALAPEVAAPDALAHEPEPLKLTKTLPTCGECGERLKRNPQGFLGCNTCNPPLSSETMETLREIMAGREEAGEFTDPDGVSRDELIAQAYGTAEDAYFTLRQLDVVFAVKKDRLLWNLLGNDVPLDDVRILVRTHAPAFIELWNSELAAARKIEEWNAGITAQAREAKDRAQGRGDEQAVTTAKRTATREQGELVS